MSSTISNLYNELQKFSHLQQLHSVLSKDLRSCRDRVLKETRSVRRELTFFRWCMRRNLNEQYPFVNASSSTNIIKGLDYDRLLFYRKLICYLHSHPIELSKIIVSLPTIKNKPQIGSLESLYFDKEIHLAECIAFDIMLTDINSLTLLLRSILLHSINFNTLSQKLFQLFIVITCHKLLNTTFRSLLNRLYKINESLSLSGSVSPHNDTATDSDILSSTLYIVCDDVLSVIISVLRLLPIPLRQCISVLKERVNNKESQLLEWLLSTIFSPLLLQPDDWYLVICNPSSDEVKNNNNIQYIVTTLLQLCGRYQPEKSEDDEKSATNHDLIQLLLDKHGATLTQLLHGILSLSTDQLFPSSVLVPSNATPELFIWHEIFLNLSTKNNDFVQLYALCNTTLPPKSIPYRPWITIQLPNINYNTHGKGTDIGIYDDFTKQPKSNYLAPFIFKPIRVFLLSLSQAQAQAVSCINKYDIEENNLNLNTQQITLLYEARARIKQLDAENLDAILNKIVSEYQLTFCNNLQEALSTHNVLSSLNYIQNKETILRELRIIFTETHENLQMRDILYLSKQSMNILTAQIEKIMLNIHQNNLVNNVNGIDDGSDWSNDKFVTQKTSKCISKTRNALIRFLNDYGIGKVDFKRKFGGSVLDFTNKRIAKVLVNAIIFEIKAVFWNRCPIEDGKFKYQIIELNNKYDTLKEFIYAFLNLADETESKQKQIKLPRLSAQTVEMMVNKIKMINDEIACKTIADFEDCIATVREALIASINGADSAEGDDYMPLFCYILMKGVPSYLPSQLQTTKVISQRKVQDKYFIDCCVAMKALRNFCNVLFKTENEKIDNENKQTESEQKNNIGTIIPQMDSTQIQAQVQQLEVIEDHNGQNSKKTTPQSLFNSLRAKLPRTTKSSPSTPNATTTNKKTFFNLTQNTGFASFMNKNKSVPSDNEQIQESGNNIKGKVSVQVPQQTAPKPNVENGNTEEEEVEDEDEEEEDEDDEENTSQDMNSDDVMVQISTKI